MTEVVRLDQAPPPARPPTRRRAPWLFALILLLAVVAVALLQAQSRHREQQRQADATAFSVRVDPDGYRQRASDLTLSVTLRNDGPLPVTVRQLRVDGLRGGDVLLVLSPGAQKAIELTGTVDCTGNVPVTAQVAVSLPSGDRIVDAAPPALSGLCAVQVAPLSAVAGPPRPTDTGLSMPLTVENTGALPLRLVDVTVRSTTAAVHSTTAPVRGPAARLPGDRPGPDVILPAGATTRLVLDIATPPSCRDLARFLDAPTAVLRFDSGPGTVLASLRVRVDRTVLPDPHDVCG